MFDAIETRGWASVGEKESRLTSFVSSAGAGSGSPVIPSGTPLLLDVYLPSGHSVPNCRTFRNARLVFTAQLELSRLIRARTEKARRVALALTGH